MRSIKKRSQPAERRFPWKTALAAGFAVIVALTALSLRFYSPERTNGMETEVATTTEEAPFIATHLPTPKPLKAIYMTGWVAGTPSLREPLLKLIDETELNAVVIDIKDYSGKLSYVPYGEELSSFGSGEPRIRELRELIADLHERGIYVIGRISAFQDAYMVGRRPDLAVRRASATSTIWKDHKGISWIDAGAREMWDYLALIGREAWNDGFDELNFDYVRFPSDGNMRDIWYPWSEGSSKPEVMRGFFEYLSSKLASTTGAVLSVDLFGMTTTNSDDLNIGQVLESALPYFDYVAPMVYPSHYPAGWNGMKNPAARPYEVIKYSMDKAVARAALASTSPMKLRPWLQDFNLGATYTPDMVRAQIKATYDSGLDSWMLWNASNRYTRGALLGQ